MKVAISIYVFLTIFSATLSFDEEKISKTICRFSSFSSANIFNVDKTKAIKLSKILFDECNLKIKIVSEITSNKNNLVAFLNMKSKEKIKEFFVKNYASLKNGILFIEDFEAVKKIPTKINQDIKFVDINSWEVYEHYEINDHNTINQIGFFNQSFQYVSLSKESWIERRSNFHGFKLKAMTEDELPFITFDNFETVATYDNISETYDVTLLTKGMFYDIFVVMQKHLNFSASLHKRLDGKWGLGWPNENGSIEIQGMFESMTSGFAEMAVTRYDIFSSTNLFSECFEILLTRKKFFL